MAGERGHARPSVRAYKTHLSDLLRTQPIAQESVRENVRARMRVMVKRILRRYGYLPDKQEKATQTVRRRRRCCAGIGPWPDGKESGEA